MGDDTTQVNSTKGQDEGTFQDGGIISADAYNQVKNDMFKYKRTFQEAADRAAKLESELQAIREKKQEEDGQYKALWEQEKSKSNDFKEKLEKTVNTVYEDKKLTAVREFAIKNNIRKEALDDLDMIDMQNVIVETTDQGRINVHGADEFVNSLKSIKPHWFVDSTPPVVNNSVGAGGNVEDQTYSPMELLKLEKENPSLYQEIMTKKQHLIRR